MKKPLVFHPVLFAVSPVLSLFFRNIGTVLLPSIFEPALHSVLLAVLLWIVLYFLLSRNAEKSGLIVSVFLVLFFSYGHWYRALLKLASVFFGFRPGLHGFLCTFMGLVLLGAGYFTVRAGKIPAVLTRFLNVVAAVLVLIPVLQIGSYKLVMRHLYPSADVVKRNQVEVRLPEGHSVFPNIYYIILDGYARRDVLRDFYAYDNRDFIEYLKAKGFYVAEESQSNYSQTSLSLASSLNMMYLSEWITADWGKYKDRTFLSTLIRHNAAFRVLKEFGYQITAFSGGYEFTDIPNADRFIPVKNAWSMFQAELIKLTPLYALGKPSLSRARADQHRKMIFNILDGLKKMPENKGPFLVFAHIGCPHPPFVFGPDGGEINPDVVDWKDGSHLVRRISRAAYVERYRDQLRFINTQMKQVIDAILANAARPTVIILQADHGPGSMLNQSSIAGTNLKERLGILNACFFNGETDAWFYPQITPVNTFRLVFNHFFGQKLSALPDKSYFSTWQKPYQFFNATDKPEG